MDHRLGDQQPPLHAARQGARIGVGLVLEMHRAEQLHRPPVAPWARRRGRPGCSSVSAGVKKGSNTISCGTMPIDALALRGCSSMSKPQIARAAAGLVHQPGEDVDQRRLARAVGAEQAEDLAARHVEADPVERALAARIGFFEVLDRNGGREGGGHASAHSRSGVRRKARVAHRVDCARGRALLRPAAMQDPSRPKPAMSPSRAWRATARPRSIRRSAIRASICRSTRSGFVECGYCDRRFILKGGPADKGASRR